MTANKKTKETICLFRSVLSESDNHWAEFLYDPETGFTPVHQDADRYDGELRRGRIGCMYGEQRRSGRRFRIIVRLEVNENTSLRAKQHLRDSAISHNTGNHPQSHKEPNVYDSVGK